MNHSHRQPASVETLEARSLLTLTTVITPTIIAQPLHAIVVGTPSNDVVLIRLTNTSTIETIRGKADLTIAAQTDSTFNAKSAIPVVAAFGPLPLSGLKPGRSVTDKIKLGTIHALSPGDYYLFAEVAGPFDAVNVSPASVEKLTAVDGSKVELSASIAFAGSTSIKPSSPIHTALKLFNAGSSTASANLSVDIGLDSTNAEAGTLPFVWNHKIKIAPGQHQTFNISHSFGGLLPAEYTAYANIARISNTLSDNATSTNTLTVVDPYPNVVGNFSGAAVFSNGQLEGSSTALSVEVSDEYLPNRFTNEITIDGNGSNVFGGIGHPFTFSGSLDSRGNFVAYAHDIDDAEMFQLAGKVVGSMITGSYLNKRDGLRAKFSVSEAG